MKHKILFVLALTVISLGLKAQQLPKSSDPYWVVESNVKTPKNSIVFFYTPDHQLMYKQKIEGKRLNIQRKKVRRQLDQLLQEIDFAWSNKRQIKDNELARRF